MPDESQGPVRNTVIASLWAAATYGVLLLLVFYATTASMVSIWLRSETFAHGFLILPISLWLIWNKRAALRKLTPHPSLPVTLLILPVGFVWLLATLVDVLVVQQLALVAMLIIGCCAIFGRRLSVVLAFPLLFLFFAVPMGEALVAPMMEFTATSTIWLIQLSGIPVYREGLIFTLPTGSWSVVAACSGVRYIIASVTLGVLYAYLTYFTLWRRVLFVLVSALVPIVANTLRAYLIVMLGHLSEMKVATGVDHLIYGWAFFGLVMFILFWLGSFFREEQPVEATSATEQADVLMAQKPIIPNLVPATVVALVLAGMWPALAMFADGNREEVAIVALPSPSGEWSAASSPVWNWSVANSVNGQAIKFYQRGGETLGLYVQFPQPGETNGELVGSSTTFVEDKGDFRVLQLNKVDIQIAGHSLLADQAQLVGVDGRLLAWSWYRVGNSYMSNNYLAKFHEAMASLGLGTAGSYRIILAAPLTVSEDETRRLLQGYLDKHGTVLDRAFSPGGNGIP